MGGSCHGYVEARYRLHALRLKLLLKRRAAGKRGDLYKDPCVNLIKKYPFNADAKLNVLKAVLIDVLKGLESCRDVEGFFHRSVYRLAEGVYKFNSIVSNVDSRHYADFKDVPSAISEDLTESAFKILHNLFLRKREQIVSVWVTKSKGQEPLGELNTGSAKFNYLRLKYLKLYVKLAGECGKVKVRRIGMRIFLLSHIF